MSCLALRPSTLLLLGAVLLPTPGDEATVARAGELEFARGDYAEWLVQRQGVIYVHDYVAEQLTIEWARERGLAPTDAEVDAAYQSEYDEIVEVLHRGDAGRYEQDLSSRGYTPASFKARRASEMRGEMAAANLARADRVISEAALEKRFRDRYGALGEHTTLETLFFSAYRDVDHNEPLPDLGKLKNAASARAEAVRRRMLAGEELATLLSEGDEPNSDFVVDGLVDGYRRLLLGREVDQAVESLDRPGEVSAPIVVFDGAWIVRLVSRRAVTLEGTRDILMEELRSEPVLGEEYARIRSEVMERYEAEILLR